MTPSWVDWKEIDAAAAQLEHEARTVEAVIGDAEGALHAQKAHLDTLPSAIHVALAQIVAKPARIDSLVEEWKRKLKDLKQTRRGLARRRVALWIQRRFPWLGRFGGDS